MGPYRTLPRAPGRGMCYFLVMVAPAEKERSVNLGAIRWRDVLRLILTVDKAENDQFGVELGELNKFVESSASWIGNKILRATNWAQFNHRVEGIAKSREMQSILTLLARRMAESFDPELLATSLTDEMTRERSIKLLGRDASDLVDSAMDCFEATAEAIRPFFKVEGPIKSAIEAMECRSEITLWDLPLPLNDMKEWIRGSLRGQACMLALIHAFKVGEPLAEWLSLALGDRILEGARTGLRYIGSIPGCQVPDALLPAEDRLDVGSFLLAQMGGDAALEAAQSRGDYEALLGVVVRIWEDLFRSSSTGSWVDRLPSIPEPFIQDLLRSKKMEPAGRKNIDFADLVLAIKDRIGKGLGKEEALSFPVEVEPQIVSGGTPSATEELSPLGRRLTAIREQIVRSGEPLLGWDDIDQEVAQRRGGADPSR